MSGLNFDFIEAVEQTQEKLAENLGELKSILGTEAMVPAIPTVESIKPYFLDYAAEITRWEEGIRSIEVDSDATANTAAVIGGEAARAIKAIKAKRDEVTKQAREYIAGVDGFLSPFNDRLKTIKGTADQKISDLKYRQRMEEQKQKAAADRAARELQERLNREAEEANRKAREEVRKKVEEEWLRAKERALAIADKLKASEEEKNIITNHMEEDRIAAIKVAEEAEAKNAIIAPTVVAPLIPETQTKVKTETGITAYGKEPWVCDIEDETLIPRQYCKPSKTLLNQGVREGVREIPGCKIYQKYQTAFRT